MGQSSAEQEMLDQIREVAFYHWTASRHQAYPLTALQSHELQLPDGCARTCHPTVVRTDFPAEFNKEVFANEKIQKCQALTILLSSSGPWSGGEDCL